ncbi:hypothetical protein D3C87_1751200 [compost metagenome]
MIAADDAGLLEDIDPARAGGRRKADFFGQFGICNPAILLKNPQDRSINCIHRHQSNILRVSNLKRNNLRKITISIRHFARTCDDLSVSLRGQNNKGVSRIGEEREDACRLPEGNQKP